MRERWIELTKPITCGAASPARDLLGREAAVHQALAGTLGNYNILLAAGILLRLHRGRQARLASLLGSIKIESRGPQNHVFTRAEFDSRYQHHFGPIP